MPPRTVSVVIPTYNGAARLGATIGSALAQSAPPHEVVVVDDGSTDATPGVTRAFAGRIRCVRVANGGQQRARNIGVAYTTGDWIALLDHDDLWEPGYLAEVGELVRSRDVDMTLCNSRTRSDAGGTSTWTDDNRFTGFAPPGYWQTVGAVPTDRWTVLHRYDYASYLRFHPSQTSMVTLSRTLWDRLGGFDERMRGSGAENFEFELRALRVARVGLVWQPLVTMVRHDANASLDTQRMAMDVADCLHFALRHHGLTDAERAAVNAELPARLREAVAGAFTLGDLDAVARYARQHPGALPAKARAKAAIAALPGPLGRLAARLARAATR